MLNNFSSAPTAGSHDYDTSYAELQARVQQLEQRLAAIEARQQPAEHPPKIKWKKVRKFFKTVVKPVLAFIPNFMNAIAVCKKAFAPTRP